MFCTRERLIQIVEARSFEYLNIAQRQALTKASPALFRHGTQAFCEFCDRRGIAAEHFSAYRTELVPWFREVINKKLATYPLAPKTCDQESVRAIKFEVRMHSGNTTPGRKLIPVRFTNSA